MSQFTQRPLYSSHSRMSASVGAGASGWASATIGNVELSNSSQNTTGCSEFLMYPQSGA